MLSAVPIADPPRTDQTAPDAVGAPPVRTTGGRPATANDRHFCTAHLADDLKGRSVRGGAVTLAAQGVKFSLQLVQTVVLARLLAPEAFGLVAMVTAVTGFVAMFKDAGLSMATVQREHITHEQISTLFWINVALSAVLALLVAALAPALAWLYGDPRLTAITLVLAGTFVLSGLAIQHQALLRRQMRFTALGSIQIITMATGVAAAITAAVLGAGYWSLVAMSIVQSVVGTILVWGMCGWMPGLPRRRTGVREVLAFGGNLTGFSLINYFARNADNILIGWYWGAGPLGLYSKAYSLLMLPLSQIKGPISGVIIPVLSRLASEPRQYRDFYLRTVNSLMWLTTPIVALLAVAADQVVLFVLGPQWQESAALFQVLAITAVFQPLYSTIGWVFTSLGRGDRMFRWAMIAGPLFILGMAAGLPFGPLGVAYGYTFMFLFGVLSWTFQYTFQGTALTVGGLVRSIAFPLLAGVAIFFGGAIAEYVARAQSPLIQLFSISVGGLSSGCIVVFTLSGARREVARSLEQVKHLRWQRTMAVG